VCLCLEKVPATPAASPKASTKKDGGATSGSGHFAPSRQELDARLRPSGIWSGYVEARPREPSRPLPTLPPGARYSRVRTGGQGWRAVAVWLPRRGRQARLQPPVDAPPTSTVAPKLGSLVLLLRRREGHPRLLPALPDLGGHRAPWAPSAGLPAGLRCPRAVSGRRPFPACRLCFRSPGRPGREGRRAPRCPGSSRQGRGPRRSSRPPSNRGSRGRLGLQGGSLGQRG
jgi:hypothetical protein